MTIISYQSIVSPPAPETLLRAPRLGWRNIFRDGVVSVSSADPAHPKELAYDGLTYDGWRSTGLTEEWIAVDAPKAYLSTPGKAFNNASCPSAGVTLTNTDLDIRMKVRFPKFGKTNLTTRLLAKEATGQGSFRFLLLTNGRLRLDTTADGTNYLTNTSNVDIPGAGDSEWLAVRATIDIVSGADRVVKYYTSTDDGQTWVQYENVITAGGATSLFLGTAGYSLGSSAGGGANIGKAMDVEWAEFYQGINGTRRARFQPQLDALPGQLSWVSSAVGEVWTVSQSLPEPVAELVFPNLADYMAVAAHTLSFASLTPQVTYDDVNWIDLDASFIPHDDRPIVWEFSAAQTPTTPRGYRLLITTVAGNPVDIGAIHVGLKFQLQRGFAFGWAPPALNEETEYTNVMSQGGQLLGRNVVRRGAKVSGENIHLAYSFAHEEWREFLDAAERFALFFWRVIDGKAEILYGGLRDQGVVTSKSERVTVRFALEGSVR